MIEREEALYRRIYREHHTRLRNLDARNPERLVIGIAGVPGSGKTLLARSIARRWRAVRVSNDDIRAIIGRMDLTRYGYRRDDGQRILQEYLFFALPRIAASYPNGCIVLDSGIERKYDMVRRWCRSNGFRLFIVRISIDGKILLRNLRKRKKSYRRYLPHLAIWQHEYRAFAKRDADDVVFRNRGTKQSLSQFIKSLNFHTSRKL